MVDIYLVDLCIWLIKILILIIQNASYLLVFKSKQIIKHILCLHLINYKYKIYNNFNNLSQNINHCHLFLLLQAFHYSDEISNCLIFLAIIFLVLLEFVDTMYRLLIS